MLRLAILLLAGLAALRAQNITGAISGTVADSSRAVVPGASVQIVNSTTNVKAWSGATDGQGAFLAPVLPVGSYNITIESKGFKKFEILAMPLEFNQRARVDAVLSPGEIQEVVTVTGESVAVLNKEDSSVGIDIDPSQIRDIR